MALIDLSRSSASKKNVDFADARYQMSDKLKQSETKNIRSTFTLYDNKEYHKTAVQDITAAYELSDKHLPIGEVLNKMVDFVVDLEDGLLDSEKDAIYAWKYSLALLELFDDKSKRQENLIAFDNSLKTSIVNSPTFQRKYPGKYTNRTNFFDQNVKKEMIEDIINTFRDETVPKIHDAAVRQSDRTAEHHNNPTLDRIVDWAVKQYNCHVDSFFQIKEDQDSGLFYSVNTVVVHLKNGYDLSIIGYVGTDHDDKFSISVLDANKIAIKKHGEEMTQDDIQKTLTETYQSESVPPLVELLKIEKTKNDILRQQYDILVNTRPMVSAKALNLKVAESVVGRDYIWGCQTFRENHEDLPKNFKLSDLKLPEYREKSAYLDAEELNEQFGELAETLKAVDDSQGNANKISDGIKMPVFNKTEALFQEAKPIEQKKFGSNLGDVQKSVDTGIEKIEHETKEYDLPSSLLPGMVPVVEYKQVEIEHSATENAKPMPSLAETTIFKPVEQALPTQATEFKRPSLEEPKFDTPELVLPSLDGGGVQETERTDTAQLNDIVQQSVHEESKLSDVPDLDLDDMESLFA